VREGDAYDRDVVLRALVASVARFNSDRLHESLGDLPPAEFETLSPSTTVDLLDLLKSSS